MSLKKKFVLVIFAVMIVPTIIGILLVNLSIRNNIYKFEDEQNQKNLESVQAILNQKVDQLKTSTYEGFGAWDDFYDAIKKNDISWIQDNVFSIVTDSKKFMVTTDLEGNIISYCGNDKYFKGLKNLKDTPMYSGINNKLNNYAGFIELPDGIAIIGVSKVIKSSDTEFSDPSGVIVHGEFLTKDMLKNINEVIGVNVSVCDLNKNIISDSDTSNTNTVKFDEYMKKLGTSNDKLLETSVSKNIRNLISIGKLLDLNNSLIGVIKVEGHSKSSIQSLTTIKYITFVTIIIIISLSSIIIVWVHFNIIVPLLSIKNTIDLRDLNNELPVKGRDEINLLSESFNNFIRLLKSTIIQIKVTSQTLASSSQEISATTEELSGSTEMVSNTSEETHGFMEEIESSMQKISGNVQDVTGNISNVTDLLENLSDTVKNVSQNIDEVKKQADSSLGATQSGKSSVENTRQEIDKISKTIGDLVSAIRELGASTVQIEEIVNVIDDISTQTNLLALNAAIEAANAGEYGKGFGVVADSVRKLAEKSVDATSLISKLIKEIQEKVYNSVELATAGAKEMECGVELAKETDDALEIIKKEVENTVKVVEKVCLLTVQQESGINQVIKSSQNINMLTKGIEAEVVQQVAANQEAVKAVEGISSSVKFIVTGNHDIAKSTETLAQEAQNLSTLVEQFKLK